MQRSRKKNQATSRETGEEHWRREDREGSPGSEGAPPCGIEARMGDDREMRRRKKVSRG